MKPDTILQLDPLIHAPTRLAILSILIGVEQANFTYLKEAINTTDGNLSTHLTKLETAGLVAIRKAFMGKKPQTLCSITKKGKQALNKYLDQLEKIVTVAGDRG
jgi:DNA-binding transcriptional ArsR family regulator